MKKLTLAVIAALISCITFAQVEIRGRIIEINKYKFDSSHSKYSLDKVYFASGAFIHLNDNEFTIFGSIHGFYKLEKKQVDSSDNDLIVSYLTKIKKDKLALLAARECEGNLIVAVIPFGGDSFIEYVIAYKKKRAKK